MDDSKKFKQKERALALYQDFRKRHMICDVENDVSDVKTDRLRKSDLVILDYHLGPEERDTKKSIALLRALSGSKHFNTVVLYTAEPQQDQVWLDVIASMTGGWSSSGAELHSDAQQHLDRLSNDETLPTASLDAIMQFAARGELRDLAPAVRKAAQDELVSLDVPIKSCGEIIAAMIHRELARFAGDYAREPRRRAVGGYANGIRWIQSQNSFVAILQKKDISGDADDPAGIMAYLSQALLAWRPNLFQILISEIQNVLELEALATEDAHLRKPVTQTALWYYLLDSLGEVDLASEPDVKAPLMGIVDKIVEGIRRRLASDADLLSLASKALLGELRDTGWSHDDWPQQGKKKMLDASMKLARTEGVVKSVDVFFTLNSFFSTEQFGHAHLTTGTIFLHPDTKEYFVAASPACDLVARQPGADQAWARSIHPLTAVVAILLHPVDNLEGPLTEAARAQHVFLQSGEEQKVFKLVNGVGQPAYEFLFAKNEGKIREVNETNVFDAARLMPKKNAPGAVDGAPLESEQVQEDTSSSDGLERELVYSTFEVVDQLRTVNATRVLQMAGQHLSRIGLDFISMPNK